MNIYNCNRCNKEFHKRSLLITHMHDCNPTGIHSCPACQEEFHKRKPLLVHVRGHHKADLDRKNNLIPIGGPPVKGMQFGAKSNFGMNKVTSGRAIQGGTVGSGRKK